MTASVIRSSSPAFTWAAAWPSTSTPPGTNGVNPEVLARFKVLEQGSPEEVLRLYLSEAGAVGAPGRN